MKREEIIQLLAERQGFEEVSAESLAGLVDLSEQVSVPNGVRLIEQGKIGEALWVLLDGKVRIVVDHLDTRQLEIPGTLLGEISAVSHTAATATVEAATDVLALRISHLDFHRALASSEQLASAVLRSLTKYL